MEIVLCSLNADEKSPQLDLGRKIATTRRCVRSLSATGRGRSQERLPHASRFEAGRVFGVKRPGEPGRDRLQIEQEGLGRAGLLFIHRAPSQSGGDVRAGDVWKVGYGLGRCGGGSRVRDLRSCAALELGRTTAICGRIAPSVSGESSCRPHALSGQPGACGRRVRRIVAGPDPTRAGTRRHHVHQAACPQR